MTVKICLRCDWQGETKKPRCPNCEAQPLYVVGGSSPQVEGTPARNHPTAPSKTMIVEFPKKTCVASPLKRYRIAHARQQFLNNCGAVSSSSWLKLAGTVTITGVGFWDEKHGQTGIAPNGIELHPVLGFTGDCHKPSTGGGGAGGGGGTCTPGYSPCLVYHGGTDYDCYGQGGNGPYFTKPGVTYSVTGSDPYRLDGNNNGLGCE